MNELIRNPYNERVKEYEKVMQHISKLERGQQWSELYTAATRMADEMLELKHRVAEYTSRNELYT
jgi:hypothetical protein